MKKQFKDSGEELDYCLNVLLHEAKEIFPVKVLTHLQSREDTSDKYAYYSSHHTFVSQMIIDIRNR